MTDNDNVSRFIRIARDRSRRPAGNNAPRGRDAGQVHRLAGFLFVITFARLRFGLVASCSSSRPAAWSKVFHARLVHIDAGFRDIPETRKGL